PSPWRCRGSGWSSPGPRASRGGAVERIPILRMGEYLLVSIQVDMHDRLALALQDDLTGKIAETNARGVLIDISALDIVASFIGRMIANISAMARVLDSETVVVGQNVRGDAVQRRRQDIGRDQQADRGDGVDGEAERDPARDPVGGLEDAPQEEKGQAEGE